MSLGHGLLTRRHVKHEGWRAHFSDDKSGPFQEFGVLRLKPLFKQFLELSRTDKQADVLARSLVRCVRVRSWQGLKFPLQLSVSLFYPCFSLSVFIIECPNSKAYEKT